MNITCISDTHGLHQYCNLQSGNLLIHAGDITEHGTEDELQDFIDWLIQQPFEYKIFIGGNHDFCLEETTKTGIQKRLPKNTFYLQNSGTKIEGLNIWGSPVTPYFLGMAFNERRGNDIRKVWKKIPATTDILITHGPPLGILDNGFGCEDLLQKVTTVKPKLHVFGHVHEQTGIIQQAGTEFINAALVNNIDLLVGEEYKIVNQPVSLSVK
jgi:Icc-related predicted phosphoesterase